MKSALPSGFIAFCVTLLFSIFISNAATEMQAKSLRVAVCGGGLSACAAANRLASRGVDVTLFEVGRGAGGRAATRRAAPDIQFNHGAQDIKTLRTNTFSEEIQRWESKGWVKPWSGQHTIRSAEGSVYRPDTTTVRYVGVPHMNSICKNLVEDHPISTHFSSKASPVVSTETVSHHRQHCWRLQGPAPESTTNWGEFDWVIGADRSCSNDLLRLPSDNNDALRAVQDEFARVIKDHFVSVPNVVLMLALKEPIPRSLFPFDSVQCEDLEGTLHRVCKDSSKPGDVSDVQKWIVQSTATFAKNLLREVDEELRGQEVTFEERKQRVNAVSKPKLLEAFRQLVLENDRDGDVARYLSDENVLCAISHRWSAAFPSWKDNASVRDLFATSPGYTIYGQGRSFVHPLSRFAACGDYLVPASEADGIEAAVISGLAAADGILKAEHL